MQKRIIYFLIAVVLNYPVAWSCTLWAKPKHRTSLPGRQGKGYPPTWLGGPYGEEGWWTTTTGLGYREHTSHHARGAEGDFTYWRGSITRYREAGWPCISLRSTVTPREEKGKLLTKWDLPLSEVLKRGLNTTSLARILGCHPERRLALVPVWGGFVVNAVLYFCGILALTKVYEKYKHLIMRSS